MSDEAKKSSHSSRVIWILIVLGFLLTGAFFLWTTRT